jgi:hypothetical protein
MRPTTIRGAIGTPPRILAYPFNTHTRGVFSDYREKTMQLEDTLVGTRVRVQLDYRTPYRQGTVGTIKKRYGIPEYTTFEVLFADGRRELFWDHQLEEAKETSSKGWWVFW